MIKYIINTFVLYMTYAITLPYLQVFLKNKGLNYTEIGQLNAIFQLAGSIGIFVTTYISRKFDIYNRLLTLNIIFVAIFYYFLHASDSFVLDAILCFFLGMTFWCFANINDTILNFNLIDYKKEYGLIRMWGSIGFISFSLLISAFNLINSDSNSSILIINEIVLCLFIVSSLFIPYSKGKFKQDKEENKNIDNKLFIIIFLIIFINNLGFRIIASFSSLYLKDFLKSDTISFMWALMVIPEIPVLFFSALIIKKFKLHNLLLIATLGTFLRLNIIIIFPSVTVFALGELFHVTNFMFVHLAILNYSKILLNNKNRALALALYGVFFRLSTFIGSIIGGYLIDMKGFAFTFRSFSIFSFIAFLLIIIYYKKLKAGVNRED